MFRKQLTAALCLFVVMFLFAGTNADARGSLPLYNGGHWSHNHRHHPALARVLGAMHRRLFIGRLFCLYCGRLFERAYLLYRPNTGQSKSVIWHQH